MKPLETSCGGHYPGGYEYGGVRVVWIKARAEGDKAAGIVTLNDIKITKAKFPIAEREAEYLPSVRSHISTAVQTWVLDHLESSYAVSQAVKKAKSVPVKNDPPKLSTRRRHPCWCWWMDRRLCALRPERRYKASNQYASLHLSK